MATKKFSDYEKMFLEKIENKTFKELMDSFCSSDQYHKLFDGECFLMELRNLQILLEEEFFEFALKEKGVLELPVISATHEDDDDIYLLMMEEVSEGYYKTVHFDPADDSYSFSLRLPSESDQTVDLEGCKTIGDFINKYSK